jgi:hypothetical protein
MSCILPSIRKHFPILAVIAILTALSAAPGRALAGQTYQYATCGKWSDGSGYCFGNFLGFRNSSDPSDFIYFTKSSDGFRSMYARIYGQSFSCVPSSSLYGIWDQVLLHQGYFFIEWNNAGSCDYLSLSNGSQFASF